MTVYCFVGDLLSLCLELVCTIITHPMIPRLVIDIDSLLSVRMSLCTTNSRYTKTRLMLKWRPTILHTTKTRTLPL